MRPWRRRPWNASVTAPALHRETGLPLAVTGGVVFGDGAPEARLMERALQEDFGVDVRWVEEESRNTEQNAALTRRLLERDGMTRIRAGEPRRAPEPCRTHVPRRGLRRTGGAHRVHRRPLGPHHLADWIPSSGALGASEFCPA